MGAEEACVRVQARKPKVRVHGGPEVGASSAATSPSVVLRRCRPPPIPAPRDPGTAMSPCGRAQRHTSRGAMAVLAWKFPRTRLPVGASALCVVVLCWLYIFPVYRLPNEKEIVHGVLQQGTAWRRNQTAARLFRYCRPRGSSPLVSFPSSAVRTGSPVGTASQRCLFHPVFLVLLPFLSIPNLEALVRGPFPSLTRRNVQTPALPM